MIKIKRAYAPASPHDGRRILVDRLWPRGLKKEEAGVDEWMKDLAPSSGLRKWFGHDPEKWREFQKRFHAELDLKERAVDDVLAMSRQGALTLLYGSKEEHFNNAAALKEYLEARMKLKGTKKAA